MTVQELIDALLKISDKGKKVIACVVDGEEVTQVEEVYKDEVMLS
jgi:hypothetical protein